MARSGRFPPGNERMCQFELSLGVCFIKVPIFWNGSHGEIDFASARRGNGGDGLLYGRAIFRLSVTLKNFDSKISNAGTLGRIHLAK